MLGLGSIFNARDTKNDARFFWLFTKNNLFSSKTSLLNSFPQTPSHRFRLGGDPKVHAPTNSLLLYKPKA